MKMETDSKPPANLILLECDQCSFTHKNEKVMNVHVQIHTEALRFGCPYCKFDTMWKDSIRSHINTKHSKIKRLRCCPYCDFKTAYKIEPHIEQNHRNLLRKCYFCKFSSSDKFEMIEHVNTSHDDESSYECWDCQYESSSLINLKMHFQSKHNEKVFQCRYCEYSSVRKKDWEIHEKGKHIREEIYKCRKCVFETSWKWRLGKHFERKHKGEKLEIVVKKRTENGDSE